MNTEMVAVADLVPYSRNPKLHPQEQVDRIAASIDEFGFTVPVVVDKDNNIIMGHGRIQAAKQLNMEEVPTIRRDDLTEEQVRALRIADNKIAMSEWDEELLGEELEALDDLGFDLELTGFGREELEELNSIDYGVDETYSQKVQSVTYTPQKENPPPIEGLYDDQKAMELIADIEDSSLPSEVKRFLKLAAYRHVKLDFGEIAEYYCHQEGECQQLMEDNALVILDFEDAIAKGYVKLREELQELYEEEHG